MDFPRGGPSTPRRKKVIDRFIPHREGVNLEAAFSVANTKRSSPTNESDNDITDIRKKESLDSHRKYSALLKSEMFGGSASSGSLNHHNQQQNQHHNLQSGGSGINGGAGGGSGMTSSASTGNISRSISSGPGGDFSPDRSCSSSQSMRSSSSLGMLSPVRSNLSLPTSPRKRKEVNSASNNMFRYSPKKLIRSESDLSDISRGTGIFSDLRPESRECLFEQRRRATSRTPLKTLDAPSIADDFYLNVIDCGRDDQVAVGLGSSVWLWNAATGAVSAGATLPGLDYVTSVTWLDSFLAVGTGAGLVKIYDVEAGRCLRTMTGHLDRASSLAPNGYLLASGSRDNSIMLRDLRMREHSFAKIEGHRGEVCGLKWNTDLNQLASGSNDNKLKIWNVSGSQSVVDSHSPLYEFDEHTSAVKGLAWSPHQRGLLASGGGFCDRKIWFWNTLTGKSISSVDTGSQVCNLAWSPRAKELISAHGNEKNDVIVWDYPTMQPITELSGHTFRVLYMALNSDGTKLITGAGDETIRVWSLYDDDTKEQESSILDLYQQVR